MSLLINLIREDLRQHIEEDRVPELKRFFKTGAGEYAEGDQFLGIRVPMVRQVLKKHKDKLTLETVNTFMNSDIHEYRLFGSLALVHLYNQAKKKKQGKEIVLSYLFHVRNGSVNNWDLVDSTAHHILGDYLLNRPKDILFALAMSDHLWSQRTAIISCLAFIRSHEFQTVHEICELFLNSDQDLIHKACGWMLREAGKKDLDILLTFLELHTPQMPRTMLRYAIEKLDPDLRQYYLNL